MKASTKGLLIAGGVALVGITIWSLIRAQKGNGAPITPVGPVRPVGPVSPVTPVTPAPVTPTTPVREDENVNEDYCSESWCACKGSNPLSFRMLTCVACDKQAKDKTSKKRIAEFESEAREYNMSPC